MSVPSPSHTRRSAVRPERRRCVSCRQLAPKAELLRVVRQPDGNIVISDDAAGRGAYIHRQSGCVSTAASGPRHLSRALRRPVADTILHSISQFADVP